MSTEKRKIENEKPVCKLQMNSSSVLQEFKFQPSREERKKVITREDQGQKDNIFLQNLMVEQTFNDTSVDLENIRRFEPCSSVSSSSSSSSSSSDKSSSNSNLTGHVANPCVCCGLITRIVVNCIDTP